MPPWKKRVNAWRANLHNSIKEPKIDSNQSKQIQHPKLLQFYKYYQFITTLFKISFYKQVDGDLDTNCTEVETDNANHSAR